MSVIDQQCHWAVRGNPIEHSAQLDGNPRHRPGPPVAHDFAQAAHRVEHADVFELLAQAGDDRRHAVAVANVLTCGDDAHGVGPQGASGRRQHGGRAHAGRAAQHDQAAVAPLVAEQRRELAVTTASRQVTSSHHRFRSPEK
ncbi:hypothetical protein [Kutzneria sp. CA-103260]|uniref:hypothetical protein n=1 Tax=Kutzneria sp. CA-103260 TaxID=2802641 RepID=UPI001BA8B453|nr:hypothetical protein [Kutzneria sp. CA-103260]